MTRLEGVLHRIQMSEQGMHHIKERMNQIDTQHSARKRDDAELLDVIRTLEKRIVHSETTIERLSTTLRRTNAVVKWFEKTDTDDIQKRVDVLWEITYVRPRTFK